MFDVIWFTEDQKDLALRTVNRLSMAEIARRELWAMHGLRWWKDVAMPGAPGVTSWAICTNYYGSTCVLRQQGLLGIQEIASGVKGAILTQELKNTDDWRESARREQADERASMSERAKAREAYDAEQGAARREALTRWTVMVGHLCGVARPRKLSFVEAQDLAAAMRMTDERDIPAPELWLEAHGLGAVAEDETPALSADPMAECNEALKQIPIINTESQQKKAS